MIPAIVVIANAVIPAAISFFLNIIFSPFGLCPYKSLFSSALFNVFFADNIVFGKRNEKNGGKANFFKMIFIYMYACSEITIYFCIRIILLLFNRSNIWGDYNLVYIFINRDITELYILFYERFYPKYNLTNIYIYNSIVSFS